MRTVKAVKTVCENRRETNENCEDGEFIYVKTLPSSYIKKITVFIVFVCFFTVFTNRFHSFHSFHTFCSVSPLPGLILLQCAPLPRGASSGNSYKACKLDGSCENRKIGDASLRPSTRPSLQSSPLHFFPDRPCGIRRSRNKLPGGNNRTS